jgi:hypothetical protein
MRGVCSGAFDSVFNRSGGTPRREFQNRDSIINRAAAHQSGDHSDFARADSDSSLMGY